MAQLDDKNWDDDERFYSSGRDSDDSPILSYRYEKNRRYAPYVLDGEPERERRSTVTILAKYFFFCTAMIMFCVLMYIPVYNRANLQLPKVTESILDFLDKQEENAFNGKIGKKAAGDSNHFGIWLTRITKKINTTYTRSILDKHEENAFNGKKGKKTSRENNNIGFWLTRSLVKDSDKFKENAFDGKKTSGLVAGWSIGTNRDTKIYVQPNNVTTLHQPKDLCPKSTRDEKHNLFLIIVVCSSTTNFDERQAIRETWGNYPTYLKTSQIFHKIRDKYKNYNYTYDLYPVIVRNTSENVTRVKRDISSFSQLIPELAKALKSNLVNVKTEEVPEKRFEDEEEEEEEQMLPEFDMNKELNGQQEETYDYDNGESNIMRIPPKDEETPDQDIHKILKLLRSNFPAEDELSGNTVPDYKVVFLLGLPGNDNDSRVQGKIEEEVEKYGDVIQEGFIDSYNNLTLKSMMMLKWINNNCGESVRYILKTDDDMYVNVPSLIVNLRNRSKEFDEKEAKSNSKDKEYLLIGDLIYGAKPVLDAHNKWYSPRYMYGGRVYPRYLSGTGYVLSAPAAQALYKAALTTHFFHLEDVFITGMCSARASPRIVPRDDPSFSYQARDTRCITRATAHKVPPRDMYRVIADMLDEERADGCERMRLTQIRRDRLKAKVPTKRPSKIGHITK